ncbi:MAG: anti-sigma factor [Desulfobacterales bacterium]
MKEKKHDHKKCILIFKRLSEYLDGELDEITYEEMRSHIKECIKCEVCLETLRRTVDICRNMKMQRVPHRLRKRLKMMAHGP